MAYYDALIAKWPDIQGADNTLKLVNINTLTVVSRNKVDVPVSSVVGKLMLSGVYLTLGLFAQGSSTNDPAHDAALGSAKLLMSVITIPNAPVFGMSDPTVYAEVKGLMDYILAYELANPGATGFNQAIHDQLLGLADRSLFWWQENGYSRQFDMGDLVAAGLN